MAIEAGDQDDLVALTTQIAAAYAAGNHLAATELPGLIRGIHTSLQGLAAGKAEPTEKQRVLTSAEIRRSIKPDALISFEDGKAYKTLRQHLAHYGLTPEAYRAKWGLPVDYPMTASAYSARRSQLARDLGLGKSRLAAPVPASFGSDDPVEDADEPRVNDATSASQLIAEMPEHVDAADEFDEGITREPFGEDGA